MPCTRTSTAFWRHFHNDGDFKLANLNLQLFSQEKTEEATPKRQEEARKKGQVAKSIEINSAFIILIAFFALNMTGPVVYNELTRMMSFLFTHSVINDFTIQAVYTLIINIGLIFFKIVLPIMFAILSVSLVVNYLQVGFIFSFEPIIPQFDRINPLNGFQRLFSKRVIAELLKSLFKVFIIGYFIYRFITKEIIHIPKLINTNIIESVQLAASLTVSMGFQIGVVILVLALMDYFYQWWEHNESLKMSKQEIKEEFKQTEGNPQIKSKIKERQRAMAMRRMMQEVPQASVIITNPTHFAVALKYDKNMSAPIIVAKGQDLVAHKIKEIGKQHKVPIVENKPLARALYTGAEIGEPIPAELYQAVAEVLAYVYRLKKRLS